MTEPDGRPARYDIQALLNMGVQPFDDLDNETMASLARGIGRDDQRPLDVPVAIGEDGTLVDGHQRLRAMLKAGRKQIAAYDVRVLPGVTAANALEKAVELNVKRRQLTIEQKAALARRLQGERKWSQATIARLFGVSRPAVSQWLAKTESIDTEPRTVTGQDGKTYPTREREPQPRDVTEPRSVWTPGQGRAWKLLNELTRMLTLEPVGRLDETARAHVSQKVARLLEAGEDFLSDLSGGKHDTETDHPGGDDQDGELAEP